MVRQARRRPSARLLAAAALLGPDLGLRWARRAMAAAERWPAACDGVWQRGWWLHLPARAGSSSGWVGWDGVLLG